MEKLSPANIVVATDERFAMPLAVTLRSLLETADPGGRIRLFILDGGLTDETRQRLVQSCADSRIVEICWLPIDATTVGELPVSGHFSPAGYYRILIPKVLPADVRRVLYLDGDLLIRRDVLSLLSLEQGDHLCLAAQDSACPYFDSFAALDDYRRSAPYIVARRPVPNAPELGIEGRQPYFNSGVMVIDVDRWRRESVCERLVECLRVNRDFVRWWDQYALNVVLAGRWGPLDLRWNQGTHIFQYPSWRQSPFPRETFESLRDDPFIVHFSSPVKPWHAECRHPYRDEWTRHLDQTEWRGWRPTLNPLRRLGKQAYWLLRERVRRSLRRTQLILDEGLVR